MKNKPDRKKYKKYFNEDLGLFFVPFIGGTTLLLFAFNKPVPKETGLFVEFLTRFILLLTQIIVAIIVFPKVRNDIRDIILLDEAALTKKVTPKKTSVPIETNDEH